jgi:hypothetical protein
VVIVPRALRTYVVHMLRCFACISLAALSLDRSAVSPRVDFGSCVLLVMRVGEVDDDGGG